MKKEKKFKVYIKKPNISWFWTCSELEISSNGYATKTAAKRGLRRTLKRIRSTDIEDFEVIENA